MEPQNPTAPQGDDQATGATPAPEETTAPATDAAATEGEATKAPATDEAAA